MPNESSKTKGELLPRQGTLRHVLIVLGLAGIGLIALYLLRNFAGALLLIFAGILLGVFLYGLTTLAVKWLRLPHALALTLVVVLLLAFVVAFFWLAGPQVFQQGRVCSINSRSPSPSCKRGCKNTIGAARFFPAFHR